MSVFDFAGAPPRDYETLVGLWANRERVTTRKAHVVLRALLDANAGVVPAEYYRALFDTDEEAMAQHALYESRMAFATRKPTEMP